MNRGSTTCFCPQANGPTELEYGLGFSVLAGKAKALHEKLGVTATQKMKEDLREELVNTLLKISADHLVSDAPQPVVLANQVPSSSLLDSSSRTQTSPPVIWVQENL